MGQDLEDAGRPVKTATLVALNVSQSFALLLQFRHFQSATQSSKSSGWSWPEAPLLHKTTADLWGNKVSVGLRLVLSVAVSIWVLCDAAPVVHAGMIGYPAARQERLLQVRVEVAGDSFRELMEPAEVATAGEYRVGTGRALLTIASGVTDWSEIYARIGTAEFQIEGTDFNGSYGTAYGGGVRLRLWRFGWGVIGVTGQYLRFSSNDDDPHEIDASWEEYDVALGAGTRRFGTFQLYAGAAYHVSRIDLSGGDGVLGSGFESAIPARGFAGMNFYPLVDFPAGQFVVNVEARFIGETPQFTLGLQYSF